MQTSTEKLPRAEINLKISLTPEELEKYENQAATRISEKVEIAGFRKGQAPKAFVISQVGPDAFFEEVLNVALPQSYFAAIQEQKIQAISRPVIKVLAKSPLSYEARVAVLPEITLKGYETIKIPPEAIAITDQEVEEVVEEMRRYRASYKPLSRAVQKGDRIEIDFQGYDSGGAALDKTKSENHPLFVGEGTLVPGFEEQIVGMSLGEKKKFAVTFPKDFHYEPLRSKEVSFETHVKKGDEVILPSVDEAFIESIMGAKKSVPEFKDALRLDMRARRSMEERKKRENTLLERLLKDAKFEVSEILIEEEVDYMIEDLRRELEGKELKLETYLEKLKNDKRDIRKEYAPEAEKRVRIRLILNYLFKEMKIEVTEKEVEMASSRLIERSDAKNREALQKNIASKGDVYMRLKNNLMLEKLFSVFLPEAA